MKEYLHAHMVGLVLTGTGILLTLALTVILSVVWYVKNRKKAAKITFYVAGSLMMAVMIGSIILSLYLKEPKP